MVMGARRNFFNVPRLWGSLHGVLATLWFSGAFAQAVSVACDDNLRPIPGSQGYQQRTTTARCEGMFESPVRAIDLEVVSFLIGSLTFNVDNDQQLVISVPQASDLIDNEIHVRAVALPLQTYYRMDTVAAPGTTALWPILDVLKPQSLTAKQLGVFGWSGDQADRTLIPVVVRTEGSSSPTDVQAELKLRSPVDLERVNWRVRDEGAATADGRWTLLNTRPIRAGDTFGILLPKGPPAKLHVEFSAKRPNIDQWLSVNLVVVRPL
jgi:hypothetical protein